MLKQSHINGYHHNHLHLYDKVRQDLFEEREQVKIRTPSITTICLLQIQAYIIQILANLPPINAKPANNNLIATTATLSFFLVYKQKRLHVITSMKSMIRQCLRWLLLVVLLVLDNIARLLNVEGEMADISASKENGSATSASTNGVVRRSRHHHQDYHRLELEDDDDDEEEDGELDDYRRSSTDTTYRDDYYLRKKSSFILNKKSDQCTSGTNVNLNNNSEPTSPSSIRRTSVTLPPSPINSPTPNFVLQPRQGGSSSNSNGAAKPSSTIIAKSNNNNNGESPILAPSRVNGNSNNNNNRHRTRSLSNNMIDTIVNKQQQQQKLRRITGQREITVQNAILPIPTSPTTASAATSASGKGKSTHSHHHHHHSHSHKRLPHSTANSVSSSESSSTTASNNNNRPRMQKTMSLSTAQQYHQQHGHDSSKEVS